ncbi:MAG: halocyanin domain-containing protein [Haloferacaceae archaeon]
MTDTSRRRVLRTTGVATLLALAGCSGGGGGDGETGPYDGWLADANGFESVADATGQSEVQIDVGAGSGLAFDPAAVKVSPGTTVVWKWTGQGGTHNVKHVDGAFESDLSGEAGNTFSHTFESAGVYKYVCEPHRTMGMKGVVEVVE